MPRRHHRDAGFLFLMLAVFLSAMPGFAFLVQSYEGDDGPVHLRWTKDLVPFVLNGEGSDDLAPDVTFAAIRQAFQTWEDVPTSRLRFDDQGVDPNATANRRDRRNVIVFDETGTTLQAPAGTGIIAVTRLNSDVGTGAISDADIIYNGRDFTFAIHPSGGQIDLVDVTVHEIGHFIGLDHTPLTGTAARQPTMNPFYSGSPGEASSLAADDIAGISHLYPTTEYASTRATISGTVTDPDGSPVFGAQVVAERSDGSLISTLTGAEAGREAPGDYTVRGLSAGQYTIRIEPFAHGITEENFSGIFTDLATEIPGEYFDNVTRADLAQIITLASGAQRNATGIDFTTGLSLPGFPFVTSLLEPSNTPDANGPYPVRVRVTDAQRVDLIIETTGADGERTTTLQPMEASTAVDYIAQITGQAIGSRIQYRIVAVGEEGRTTYFPGQDTWLDFDVVSLSGSPLAFAVMRSAGAVRVFDTGSDLEISRIAIGEDPIQVVSSSDGQLLFVADLATDQVVVIDRTTFTVVERISVADAPLDMAMSIDGTRLFVTNSDAGRLTAIDIDGLAVSDSWVVGQNSAGPYGVSEGASGRIYLTDLNADELIVFEGDRVIRRLAGPSQPRALSRTGDGATLFISSFDSGELGRLDDETLSIRRVDLGVQGTFAVLAHPTLDRVYLTAHLDNLLLVVESTTGRVVRRVDVGNNPRGLSLSPDGRRLYVTSATSDEIHILDTESESLVGIYPAAGGPRGIVVVESPEVRSTVIDTQTRPAQWSLSDLYPNPFNPEAQLLIQVGPDGGVARLEVYNAMGQRIRTLQKGRLIGGQQVLVSWDGRDSSGHKAGSGVYLFVLQTPQSRLIRKGLLLR